jgi:carboxymethylenebutenolidase
MCFDHDSRPPIAPISGGALDGKRIDLAGPDGNRLVAFRVRPSAPSGNGIVILPDVRGLHRFYEELALRFAEHGIDAVAIDWFGRTPETDARDASFDHMTHVAGTSWPAIASDIAVGVEALRADGIDRIFTIGFCMGGRMSFLTGTLGLDVAGVIGMYGTLAGPWGEHDAPAPLDLVADIDSPVLGLFGGDDPSIPADAIAAFDAGLAAAGTDRRIVTYPDTPHSFFDRKAEQFAAESAAAWAEILAFVESRSS